MTREEMLRRVQMLSFVLVDVNEYLDTHPNCERALCFFRKYNELYKQAVAEFESAFGPLTAAAVKSTEVWTWVDEPWPWEVED